jgi:transcription elongation factor GreA
LSTEVESLSLAGAATAFLSKLPPEDQAATQPEITNFVRWFGSQRLIGALTAAEVENFAERLSQSDTEYLAKLEKVKSFLSHAKKARWTKTNLATSLKPHKTKARKKSTAKLITPDSVSLTLEGFAKLESELANLKERRMGVIEDIRKAAADKDFRENVPFHAAREEKSHLDGRILELEATLKSASILDAAQDTSLHITIGNTVVLCDIITGEECTYQLVSPREVDLKRGKISSVSPIGQAVMGKSEGDTAEVSAPAGKIQYQIKKIQR